MGEVYRARDTKLGRDVAIKILPRAFTSDPQRLVRFEREARVLAALNHPHIAAIYGLEEGNGVRALVLELVEGETLAELLARSGPEPGVRSLKPHMGLKIDTALSIARQIAEALEAAHEKGIIHRDLKPANIILQGARGPTPTRWKTAASSVDSPPRMADEINVKVLDFGLAKAIGPADTGHQDDVGLPHSPSITAGGTREGVILGTAAYMSPEQARGHAVDKRTDIWAFGCVLYEMLTGRIAFERDTVSDTIAAIIEREPDWSALPADLSPTLQVYLRRCLEKNPRDRVHDVADLRLALEGAFEVRAVVAEGRVADSKRSRWLTAGLLLGAITAGAIAWVLRPVTAPATTPDVEAIRFSIEIPSMPLARGNPVGFDVSPDGRTIAFISTRSGGPTMLFVRPIGSLVR